MDKKIEAQQIGKIKQLQKLRGMDDESYRDALAEWGVTSCKELSYARANSIIALWRQLAITEGRYTQAKPSRPLKYGDLDGRGPDWPSGKQLRLLDTLFGLVSTEPNKDEAFASFLLNRFAIAAPTHILKRDVQRIKKALDEMKRQQDEKERSEKHRAAKAQRTNRTVQKTDYRKTQTAR